MLFETEEVGVVDFNAVEDVVLVYLCILERCTVYSECDFVLLYVVVVNKVVDVALIQIGGFAIVVDEGAFSEIESFGRFTRKNVKIGCIVLEICDCADFILDS